MGIVVEEVKTWNTPTVGAFLLWNFTNAYMENHKYGEAPHGLLLFVALAILTDQKTLAPVNNQRKSLQSFAMHFETKKQIDALLGIQDRVEERKHFTLQSIEIGCARGLLFWDVETGRVISKEAQNKPKRGNALKGSMKTYGEKAKILGKWFSEHELPEIAAYLKVVF